MLRISDALTGSVGNMVSTESPTHARKVFENLLFLNFWVISVFSILLFTFINPFIRLWVGDSYLLQLPVVFIICLNMYMRYIRNTGLIFIDTYGLFKEIRIKCVMEAAINLCISLVFLIPLKLGILGVLLGTFVSNITTNFWFEPYVIYKHRFSAPLHTYFYPFAKYFVITLCMGGIVWIFAHSFTLSLLWADLLLKFTGSLVLINGLYLLLFHRTPEFQYVYSKIKNAGK
jgi:O-antigen/teichoic acid export membrane protein